LAVFAAIILICCGIAVSAAIISQGTLLPLIGKEGSMGPSSEFMPRTISLLEIAITVPADFAQLGVRRQGF
jgi:hypothetical protein